MGVEFGPEAESHGNHEKGKAVDQRYLGTGTQERQEEEVFRRVVEHHQPWVETHRYFQHTQAIQIGVGVESGPAEE